MRSLFKFRVYCKDVTFSEWLKWHYRVWKDRYYRRKYVGTHGELENGVEWRLTLPNKPDQDSEGRKLLLEFDDPTATGCIFNATRAHLFIAAIEDHYKYGQQGFQQNLARIGLQLADLEDPEGYYVKPLWK